jgi:Gpi18-like mannosyltransferase
MALRNIRGRLSMLFGWLRSGDGLAYLTLMVVALGVRLYIAPRVMVSFDMGAYDYWGQLANQNLFHVYSIGSHASSWVYLPTYPPVAIYLYGLLDNVVFGLATLVGHPLAHDVPHSPLLKLIFKLPGISADLALLTVLYVKALAVMRRWVAWLLAATYALSPGILITVVFWGQTDGVVLALVVAGLLFALRKQPVWAGIFLALAVNFKPQPIVFVPLALVFLWRWGSFRLVVRGAIAFLAVTVAVWLPYLIPPFGELSALAHNIGVTEQAEGLAASHGAWNLWPAVGLEWQSTTTHLIGPLTIALVGYALLVAVILIAVLGVWRDGRPLRMWAGAALIALAFFTVATLQFERYLFPALGLFFLAALYDRRYWLPYAAVSVTFMANFESELLGCACDPFNARVPLHLHRVIVLHLDPWQGGMINCAALLVSVVFFLWPRNNTNDTNTTQEETSESRRVVRRQFAREVAPAFDPSAAVGMALSPQAPTQRALVSTAKSQACGDASQRRRRRARAPTTAQTAAALYSPHSTGRGLLTTIPAVGTLLGFW